MYNIYLYNEHIYILINMLIVHIYIYIYIYIYITHMYQMYICNCVKAKLFA